MRQELGRQVVAAWPRRLDATARLDQAVRALADEGRLVASIRVPDAASDLGLEVDLRARQVTTSIELAAPREGRAKTRVNWLLRQLRDAPDDLRIDVAFPNTRGSTSELLRTVREAPERLLLKADPKREPKAFTVAWTKGMASKRGKLAGSFVDATKVQTLDFYREIVQRLRKWTPGPPQLPPEVAAGAGALPAAADEPESGAGLPKPASE
jgi:hypothetical protein